MVSASSAEDGDVAPPPPSAAARPSRWRRDKDRRVDAAPLDGVPLQAAQHVKVKGKGKGRGGKKGKADPRPTLFCATDLASGAYNQGASLAYRQRYADDIARVYSRDDLPADARWIDSHCHLESILQRTWRGGGKPQVKDREAQDDLPTLVAS